MGGGNLLELLRDFEKVELFTRDVEGRSYCAVELYRLLRKEGMGAEAKALRRSLMRGLGEQAEKFRVASVRFRYRFLQDYLSFTLHALDAGLLNPLEAGKMLTRVEEEVLALRTPLNPPPALWLVREYAGFAAAHRDVHYLDRAWAFLEKAYFPEDSGGEDHRGRALLALARGLAETGAALGLDMTGRVARAVELLRDPMDVMRGRYLLYETARKGQPLLGAPPSVEDVSGLASQYPEGPRRAVAFALAAALAARAGCPADADAFFARCMAELQPGFLLLERGRHAERCMRFLAEAAMASREPRHLDALEDFLYAVKPRHDMFQHFAYAAFAAYMDAMLRAFVETGEETYFERARRMAGSSAPVESMLALAGACVERGKFDDALRLLYRIEDEQRGLRGFALEAHACRGKADTSAFITALERGLNFAEIAGDGNGSDEADAFLAALFRDAVETARPRFFRVLAAMARRRYGCSDARYRIEIRGATGLMQIGRRGRQPDLEREGEEMLNAMPALKRLQGWLAWHAAAPECEAAPQSAAAPKA